MDSALNKIGLYDFLAVLLTGMITVLSLTYLQFPIFYLSMVFDESNQRVITFFLNSYFCGLVLREAGSFVDKRMLKFVAKAEGDFLCSRKIVSNPLELSDFQKMANHILKKPEANVDFTKDEHRYLLKYCQMYLETRGKDGKYETMHSLFVMSRSLMVSFSCVSLSYLFFFNAVFYKIHWQVALVLISVLFYYRANNFSKYRVRAILRHYRSLTRDD